MSTIKIETGLKVYDIEDESGNIRGQISFNPSDMNFFDRASNFENKIQSILDDVKEKSENISKEEGATIISNTDKLLKVEVNNLFDDSNASNVVFGNQNCLNTLHGVTFIERFIEAFMPIIKDAFKEQNKQIEKRIKNYTSKVSSK